MTDNEWNKAMLKRLDMWLHWDSPEPRPKLPRWMGMTTEGFIAWRETGQVARETRILWTLFLEELEDGAFL